MSQRLAIYIKKTPDEVSWSITGISYDAVVADRAAREIAHQFFFYGYEHLEWRIVPAHDPRETPEMCTNFHWAGQEESTDVDHSATR